jgi:hypothetical protein
MHAFPFVTILGIFDLNSSTRVCIPLEMALHVMSCLHVCQMHPAGVSAAVGQGLSMMAWMRGSRDTPPRSQALPSPMTGSASTTTKVWLDPSFSLTTSATTSPTRPSLSLSTQLPREQLFPRAKDPYATHSSTDRQCKPTLPAGFSPSNFTGTPPA